MRVLILAGCLALAACATTKAPANLGTTASTAPKALCPAAVKAPSEPEPLLPAGVDLDPIQGVLIDALGEDKARDFRAWLVEFRGWGQAGWRRIDTARRNCPS